MKPGTKVRIKSKEEIAKLSGISVKEMIDMSNRGHSLPKWGAVSIVNDMIGMMGNTGVVRRESTYPGFFRIMVFNDNYIWPEFCLEQIPKHKLRRKTCQT